MKIPKKNPTIRVEEGVAREILEETHEAWWDSLDPFFQDMFMEQLDEDLMKATERLVEVKDHWVGEEIKRTGTLKVYVPGDPVPKYYPQSVLERVELPEETEVVIYLTEEGEVKPKAKRKAKPKAEKKVKRKAKRKKKKKKKKAKRKPKKKPKAEKKKPRPKKKPKPKTTEEKAYSAKW